VNKWVQLAAASRRSTAFIWRRVGQLEQSPRSGLRALASATSCALALMSGGSCWGFCADRDFSGLNFSKDEAEFLSALAPHLAQACAPHCARSGQGCRRFDAGIPDASEDLSVAAATGRRLLAVRNCAGRRGASCRRSSTRVAVGAGLRAAHLALWPARAARAHQSGARLIVHARA